MTGTANEQAAETSGASREFNLRVSSGTALGTSLASLNPIATPLAPETPWIRIDGQGGRTEAQRRIEEQSADAHARIAAGEVTDGLKILVDIAHGSPDAAHLTRNFFLACLENGHFPMSEKALNVVANGLKSNIALTHIASNIGNAYARAIVYQSSGGENTFDINTIDPLRFEILTTLLTNYRITNISLEKIFVSLRKRALEILSHCFHEARGVPPRLVELAEAFAMQAFENEFLWTEDEEETAIVDRLADYVRRLLEMREAVPAPILFIVGAYRSLDGEPMVRDWVTELARAGAVDATLSHLVLDRVIERQIAERIPTLTEIDAGVSSSVRAQYEVNPYPRWRLMPKSSPTNYLDVIRSRMRGDLSRISGDQGPPAVLIAGAGTGQSAIGYAQSIRDATIVGVDLSRASLAYGTRMAHKLGVVNLTFAHADLLKLQALENRFDIVDASGVLHHMRDTEEGLQALIRTLKPGGYAHIALYSEIARRDVAACRALVAERGFGSDLAGLRAFREYYLERLIDQFPALVNWRDFYTASELRDLVFHVQEHNVTVPQIAGMLERAGLTFIGFKHTDNRIPDAYAKAYPDDPDQTNLENWHAFEEQKPSAFAGMYQFWTRKNA